MKIFTGLHKKSIAGVACALGICLFSTLTFGDDSAASASISSESTTPVISEQAATTDTQVNNASVPSANNTPAVNPSLAPKPINQPTKTNTTSQLASVVGGLVLILLLIYGLSWFVKRFSQGGFMQNASMKIVSSMPLGTRERLMLIDVGGKQILLGVTASNINTLHVFDEPIVQPEKPQVATSEFSQKLMAILQQKNVAPNDNSQNKSKW